MDKPPVSVKAIFDQALEIVSPVERAAYLDQACAASPELRAKVEALLQAYADAGSFLEKPAPVATVDSSPGSPQVQAAAVSSFPEGPGSWIGSYKLLQKLGEGGMGTVWVAEQTGPVKRRVALKVIKPGMDSAQVLRRFEAERQALALMDHTHIAKVFDAGTTGEGRPYFVMELVRGAPMTKYCDELHLPIRERLELFVPVCQAIQHAHQKGIIHRDIKPSNVLVAIQDGKPVAKVIDFGVAKAVHQRLTEESVYTEIGQVIGTLEYMSPEQAELSVLDIDTRADIYALGAVLYELLTGSTPLERKRLHSAAFAEMLRMIKEEEPPKPSTRLTQSQESLASLAVQRRTEPAKLAKAVRGELDWIVMKCLEKDRTRRYDTANSLARDVERYLRDEPVEACPPAVGYRVRKFARKYRTPMIVAAAFAVLLVAGVFVSTWQAVRARRAESDAVRQRDLAAQEATNAHAQAQRAEENEKLTRETKRESDRWHYASELTLAGLKAETGQMGLVQQLLREPEPQGASDPGLRGFEWYYLQRLRQLDLRTLQGHAGGVWGVAYSPDGRRLASASADQTVKIWDTATGQECLTLKGHTGKVSTVVYSPDGRRLASASWDGTVKIWDAATGQECLTLQGHTGVIFSVTYSPDSRRLASASADQTVKVWDAATGQELVTLRGHTNAVWGVAYSPDGRRLASASDDQTVKVWDVATSQNLLTLEGHTRGVHGLAYSPDGRHVASASFDQTVKIWDAASGREGLTLKGHTGLVYRVAYSPDGRRLASSSADLTVKVWDTATGQELLTLKGHTNGVYGLAYSPDGRCLASSSADQTVKVWDAASSQECLTLQGHTNETWGVAYSPDGRHLASASLDQTVKIWDAATGQECLTLKGHTGLVYRVAYSPDGRRLASSSADLTVKVWDTATGQELLTLKGHTYGVHGLAYSPDGRRLASASWDKTVKVWDTATGQECLTLKGHTGYVLSVVFSPDSRRLASASGDGTVKIWDATTGQEGLTLKGHSDWVYSVAFSLKGHTDWVYSVAYSPDGRRLASASWDQTVKVWDTATGQECLTLRGHTNWVNSVAYSPDGRRLATAGSDQTIKIWDASTGQDLLTLKGPADTINVVAFSPDGRCLASAGWDGTVKIWEATALTPQRRIEREARGLVQFLIAKPLPPDEAAAAIRRDPTITEAVRQQALAWMEPFWRSQIRYEAARLVEPLFAKPLLRSEVLAAIRADAGLREAVRQEALTLAETFPENAYAINMVSWVVVRLPGAHPAAYQRALRQSQAACRLAPDNLNYINTLGAAYYRVGKYAEAVAALEKCLPGHISIPTGDDANDLYFLAMCHYQLGNAAKARECFERAKDSQQRNAARLSRHESEELQGFRSEAERLLEKPTASQ